VLQVYYFFQTVVRARSDNSCARRSSPSPDQGDFLSENLFPGLGTPGYPKPLERGSRLLGNVARYDPVRQLLGNAGEAVSDGWEELVV
jgi:hypothetical protein